MLTPMVRVNLGETGPFYSTERGMREWLASQSAEDVGVRSEGAAAADDKKKGDPSWGRYWIGVGVFSALVLGIAYAAGRRKGR